jgi:mycothiol synthase
MAELTTLHSLTARPYRPEDAAALTELYNTVERDAGGHPGYTADETQAVLDATVADRSADTRLLVTADGVLTAAGVVATPPAGGFRVDLYGGVDPSWRGRGVGRDLFAWQVARAQEIHRATAPDADWKVEASALVADETATRLFERFGFRVARYYFEMLAPAGPDAAKVAPLPADLRVVTYEPRHEKALYDTHMEAFSDHWGYQKREFENWTMFTTRNELFRPDLSRIAFDGDEIASYVLAYDDADPDRVYIGQVGTRRPWRRRGLAGALLADVLTATAAAGTGFVYLGVDADSPTGAVGVYERVGFEVEAKSVSYQLSLR